MFALPSINTETTNGLLTWTFRGASSLAADETIELVADRASEILAAVTSAGALRIRGLRGLKSAQDFSGAIAHVLPQLRDYVGGTSPRTRVHDKIMTATYTPDSWSIILHQEMAYTSNPPAFIAFFCESPASVGGDSTYGEMRTILGRIDPAVRARLEAHGLRLCRTLPSPETVHLKPGVKKPWTEVFETDDKGEVAETMRDKGWTHEWLSSGDLRLWQDLVPAVRIHPVTGDRVWCNQAHFFAPECMIRWAEEDGRMNDRDELINALESSPETLDRMYLGNGEPVPVEDALHLFDVMRQAEQSVVLEPSDLLIVDNLLVSHGRKAFRGNRNILVALADRSS